MRWKDVVDALGNRTVKILKQTQPEAEVCALWSVDSEVCPEEHLLFGRYSQLPKATAADEGTCLLLHLDSDTVDAARWASYGNVAAVSDGAEFEACLEILGSFFRQCRQLERRHRRLLDLIVENADLAALINEIADIYGHYSDIVDNSLNIMAISENIAPPTENLLQDHQLKYVEPHVVQYLRHSGNLDKMQQRAPVLVEDEPRNTYAYSVPIFIGATVKAGYLCIFVSKGETLSPAQLLYLPRTARLLSLEMQKSRSSSISKSTYFSHLLGEMLQGSPPTIASYEQRFKAFHYDLRRWKNILVMRLDADLPPATDIHLLCRTLQALFTNCVYMIHEEHLVFLISRDEPLNVPEEDLERWRDYTRANGLRLGIGSVFENPTQAGTSFRQARQALALCERFAPEETLCAYDEMRMLDMVEKLAAKGDLQALCFPPLLHLLEEDAKEPQASLFRTLECYLKNQQSVSATCKELFIHRNTLYYRLDKVRDMMNCDFSKPEHVAQITLTFTILQYLGQLPHRQ